MLFGVHAQMLFGVHAQKKCLGGNERIYGNDLDHVHFQSALDRSPIDGRVQCSTQIMLYNYNMLYIYNIMKAES